MELIAHTVSTALATWVQRCNEPSRHRDVGLSSAINEYSLTLEAREDGGALLANIVWPAVCGGSNADRAGTALTYEVVSGLLNTNGWRMLFETQDLARAFVIKVLSDIDATRFSNMLQSCTLEMLFTQEISGWLMPEANQKKTSMRNVLAALFGEPWCELIYDSRADSDSLAGLIKSTMPDFLPGLLIAEPGQMFAQALPELGC